MDNKKLCLYPSGASRGNFPFWISLRWQDSENLQNPGHHFQIAELKWGEQSAWRSSWATEDLPAELRSHYNRANSGASIGSQRREVTWQARKSVSQHPDCSKRNRWRSCPWTTWASVMSFPAIWLILHWKEWYSLEILEHVWTLCFGKYSRFGASFHLRFPSLVIAWNAAFVVGRSHQFPPRKPPLWFEGVQKDSHFSLNLYFYRS